jgi:hypothetical protein
LGSFLSLLKPVPHVAQLVIPHIMSKSFRVRPTSAKKSLPVYGVQRHLWWQQNVMMHPATFVSWWETFVKQRIAKSKDKQHCNCPDAFV